MFAQNLGVELQDSVYRSFVRKDFVFYSSSNSTRMIAVLSGEVPRYIYNVVQPFMLLTAQLFVTAVILLGLMYLDVRAVAGRVYRGGRCLRAGLLGSQEEAERRR